jgi:hypothetical protein
MGFQLESLFARMGFQLESCFAMMGFQLESLFCYDGFSARESVLFQSKCVIASIKQLQEQRGRIKTLKSLTEKYFISNQDNDMAALGKVRRIWLGMNNWAIFRGCNTHILN